MVVERFGGTVEKFIGDAVMAAFGAPVVHEDDPERAVRAGLALLDAVEELNTEQRLGLAVRVGVATGEAVVSTGARPERGEGMLAGDVVNTAARLQTAAPVGGVLVGQATWELTRASIEYEPHDPVVVKGKADPLPVWVAVGGRGSVGEALTDTSRPMIGRLDELAMLQRAYTRALREGSVQLVTVVGEPGLGKSRLVQAFSDWVDDREELVTWRQGRCVSYGDAVTFAALSEIVKAHVGILDGDPGPQAMGKLVEAVRALADGTDLASQESWLVARLAPLVGLPTAETSQEELFTAWRRFLETVAAKGPLVLVVEDLHWADRALLDFLTHLLEWAAGVPLVIVATGRPELFDIDPHWGSGHRNSTTLTLAPLSQVETAQLITSLLGTVVLPAGLHAALLHRAEGNPLYTREYLNMLTDQAVDTAHLDAGAEVGDLTDSLPGSVQAVIAARLDTLTHESKHLLQAAAVVGHTFWTDAVAALVDVEESTVAVRLHDLARRDYLRPARTSSIAGQTEYTFNHALIADVAYQQLPRSTRAIHHHHAGDWHATLTSPDAAADDDTDNLDGQAPVIAHHSPTDGRIGHHLAEACRYRVEQNQHDSYTSQLAVRSVGHLVQDAERALGYADRSAAERNADRIVQLLTSCHPDPHSGNLPLMEQTAKLLVTMGRWHDTVALLSPFEGCGHAPLLRDLGVALCKIHRSQPRSREYRRGQQLLKAAAGAPHPDKDALASLAGTWKGVDDSRALGVYREVLRLDPADPYALGNVLEYEIAAEGGLDIVAGMTGQIEAARERCRSQSAAGENLPWAWFDGGKLSLLLGRPYEALRCYAKAVQLTTADHMLVTSLASLARIASNSNEAESFSWAEMLLGVGRRALFPDDASLPTLPNTRPLSDVDEHSNVVLLAGETESSAEQWVATHGDIVLDGFEGFHGVVVSGGTRNGIPGLAGAIRKRYADRVTAIGYLPADIPSNTSVDTQYDQLRRTDGREFSIAESLLAWADLLSSGLSLTTVKLLAFNGGPIAAVEYRMALALGSSVGVVAGSGREADRLLGDTDWCRAPNLTHIAPEAAALQRFLEVTS